MTLQEPYDDFDIGSCPDARCNRCGGDGHVEYDDAPETWGEDCPSEKNHLVICPECDGTGMI